MQNDTRVAAAPASADARADRALRITAFFALVVILIQFGLGMWQSLYGSVPASDDGKGAFAAFGDAVSNGPAVLAVHAVLGTLLLLSGLVIVIRAIASRRASMIVTSVVGLLALIGAWQSGSEFTGNGGTSSASFGMAIACAVAILCYAAIPFIPRPAPRSDQ